MPGETKVWQYITLMRRIFLIDCPGVVYERGDSATETVLKGVVRVESLSTPEDHVEEVLRRVKPEYISRTYGIANFSPEDHMDFLEKFAVKAGRLLKGGEADVGTVARMVLHDWQRGRIPYFTPPPAAPGKGPAEEETEMVQQDFKAIMVTPGFSHADLKGKTGKVKKAKPAEPEKASAGGAADSKQQEEDAAAMEDESGAAWDELEVDGEEAGGQEDAPPAVPTPAAKRARKEAKPAQPEAQKKKKPAKTKSKATEVVAEPSRQSQRKRIGEVKVRWSGSLAPERLQGIHQPLSAIVRFVVAASRTAFALAPPTPHPLGVQSKAPRMTTNKKGGQNYYDTVDVKGKKNRKRKVAN